METARDALDALDGWRGKDWNLIYNPHSWESDTSALITEQMDKNKRFHCRGKGTSARMTLQSSGKNRYVDGQVSLVGSHYVFI